MKAVNHACSVFLRRTVLRMKELGLNHTTLAARMHVSRPYVAKVLAGDVNISFGTALKFAKALQMDFMPVLRPRLSSDVEREGNRRRSTR